MDQQNKAPPRRGATTTTSQHGGEGMERRAGVVQDVAVGVRGFNEVCRRGRGEARDVGYTHLALDAAAGRIVGGEGHGGQR